MKKLNKIIASILIFLFALAFVSCNKETKVSKPNIILIMTDDQGYGDFGFMGNPLIETPNIDALAERSAQMTNFYVSPVCAPTRASLMTGRYNYRTKAVDTFLGRAMMDTEEITIAEIMRDAGYATSIFGKWHLGDNYPMRPQDQGFDEVLVHRGGGIGQESDPPGGEGKYTNPILFHNGEQVTEKGFCTDIYFNKAMQWMEEKKKEEKPFFIYLSTNTPHTPVADVPEELYQKYKELNLNNNQFPQSIGHPLPAESDTDRRARIYAMITNIDQNIGKLFDKLSDLELTDNTMVIFLTDNGPNGNRYVAGMRGYKTMVYEGGIRSPLLIQWSSGKLKPKIRINKVAAHIDLLPTILEACEITLPDNHQIDGRSFLPLLRDEKTKWEDRSIVLQAHRGNRPVPYHNFALRTDGWKLLHSSGFLKEKFSGEPQFELYDMINDPLEMTNLAMSKPEIVNKLKMEYDEWYTDVSSTRIDNYTAPRIPIGTIYENPVVLTRQDWQQISENPWLEYATGYWRLKASENSSYNILIRFRKRKVSGEVILKINNKIFKKKLVLGKNEIVFESINIPEGDIDLQAQLQISKSEVIGSWQVEVKK